MSEERTVICRLVREHKPKFTTESVVVLRDDPQKRHAVVLGCATEGHFAGTTALRWQDSGEMGVEPTEQLILLSEWEALQARQSAAKNYWSMPPSEQKRLRGMM